MALAGIAAEGSCYSQAVRPVSRYCICQNQAAEKGLVLLINPGITSRSCVLKIMDFVDQESYAEWHRVYLAWCSFLRKREMF